MGEIHERHRTDHIQGDRVATNAVEPEVSGHETRRKGPGKKFCACGCGTEVTNTYRVVRGHGHRVPAPRKPEIAAERKSPAREPAQWRMTHVPDDPPPVPTSRPCMRCTRAFMSEGPHHRHCQPCRDLMDHDTSPVPTGRLRMPRQGGPS